jgi:hypothetical protein
MKDLEDSFLKSWDSSVGIEETTKNSAKILTEGVPNTSLERYSCNEHTKYITS